ncbi:MAG: valine--tRNA ligase [Dehalococcoidia bacterium]|nr:valine--tRNA ligase [Dehalococcoidia bacterium]
MTQPSASSELPKAYDPSTVEQRLYTWWMERGLFQPTGDPARKPFVIIQPPPNVTGDLHVGHALTATVEDIMARWRRMHGDPTLWLPGLDHAGIATQVVVERELAREGLTRRQLGREQFLKRVWDWVDRSRSRIGEQHERLGASLDWSRQRFTLDPGPSLAVRTTFLNLWRDKLVYRGERMINWCPRCSTALSDLEVEHREQQGHLWHLSYPLADGSGAIVVATTRPETMLGDTAVAVNPADGRYAHLVGKQVRLPLVGRLIPVIADEAVAVGFGTGALKITPAHDPTDFEIGARHGLPMINVMDLDATMNDQTGEYRGLDRYEARKRVVADLERQGLLVKIEPYSHAVGHCQRCHQTVEPLLSKQWFVRTTPLAQPAIEAVRSGAIRIIPDHFAKVYQNWMGNIRDWCISRQLWWGHRIPVWYCARCDGDKVRLVLSPRPSGQEGSPSSRLGKGAGGSTSAHPEPVEGRAPLATRGSTRSPRADAEALETDTLAGFFRRGLSLPEIDSHIHTSDISLNVTPLVGVEPPASCPACGSTGLFQDPDVLDTWFSSALWPHSTLGWPDDTADLRTFYPTSVMETSYDILFFWVARMIMMGIHNTGQAPFRTVYLHGLVRDVEGAKMSKTRGNVLDPTVAIEQYGADALRFALTVGTTAGTDMRLAQAKLEAGRNFANKLWNASRFVLRSLDAQDPPPSTKEGQSLPSSEAKGGGIPAHPEPVEGRAAAQVTGWQSPTAHTLEDRWVLSRLNRVTAQVTRLMDEFQFGEAEQTLYDFIWDDFCDWYLEAVKVRLRQGAALHPSPRNNADTEGDTMPASGVFPAHPELVEGRADDGPLPILAHVLERSLRLLHPFMPFVTEEVWQHLKPRLAGSASLPESIMVAAYPAADPALLDNEAEQQFTVVSGIVRAVRNARAEFRVEPTRSLEVLVDAADLLPVLEESTPVIKTLARAELRFLGPHDARPDARQALTSVVGRVAVFLPMAALIDVAAERVRLQKELAECQSNIQRLRGRLADARFTEKAPAEVVERERARLTALSERHAKVSELLATLPQ